MGPPERLRPWQGCEIPWLAGGEDPDRWLKTHCIVILATEMIASFKIFLFERDIKTLELISEQVSVSNWLFIDIQSKYLTMTILFTGLPQLITVTYGLMRTWKLSECL